MTVEELEKVKKSVVRRYQLTAGLALHGVDIELDKSIDTAAVVGEKNDKGIIEIKKIVVNPDFFDRLSFSERVFVLAHEAMHIALKHFARSLDKPEKDEQRKYDEYCQIETDEAKRQAKRAQLHMHYQRVWNIATDACINAFLKKDGFSFPTNVTNPKTGQKMQFVELADGLVKSAEKIYDQLVQKEEEEAKKKQEEQKNQEHNNQGNQQSSGNNQNSQNQNNSQEQSDGQKQSSDQNSQDNENDNKQEQGNNNSSSIDNINPDEYDGFDSHEQWTGKSKDNSKEEDKKDSQRQSTTESQEEHIDDEDIFNKELENREKQSQKDAQSSLSKIRAQNGIGKAEPTKPILSWKMLLTGILEKTEEVWSTRRSSRSYPNPRVEERIIEGLCSIEVRLDVSSSISMSLLRGFLLQLYEIFEEIYDEEDLTMKVGTFSDTVTDFQVIRSKKEIAEYRPVIGGGTNFELAATSFSPDPGKEMVKIVFTDGCLGRPQVTRVPDIIWIVFGDKMDFTPVGGRIIHVSEKDYKDMLSTELTYTEEDNYGRGRR